MNAQQLHDALGELPEDIILPTAAARTKRQHPWIKWAALAACLGLMLSFPFMWQTSSDNAVEKGEQDLSQENYYGYLADGSAAGSVTVVSFTAQVLEVHETYLMVSPLEGEREHGSADRIQVSLAQLEQAPSLAVGDMVRVFYSGTLEEVYPPRAVGVWALETVAETQTEN